VDEQERSPKELNQNSQKSEIQSKQNGFIKNPRGKLYLPESYLSKRKKKSAWLLKPSIREKTAWDWLKLIFAPALIALIAGGFTLYTNTKQNQILAQREEAEKDRNQQALLIEYLDEISGLVEQKLLTLNDDDNSRTQRTIARARTLSVLRALDSDRKGELIQFLIAAQLIKRDKPIINLSQADLEGVNFIGVSLAEVSLAGVSLRAADLREVYLREANLRTADLEGANLSGANLSGANLRSAYLWKANLWGAILSEANLRAANLSGANLRAANLSKANLRAANLSKAILREANLSEANLSGAIELNPTEIKSACNWKQAKFSEEFKQKLAQEPDQKVDCSYWDWLSKFNN
jgi:uncharacterized protein YjbI with pentapeptide repeats